MKIIQQITEEADRYATFYGHRPEHVFLGSQQCEEIDAMVANMMRMGLMVKSGPKLPRAVLNGMEVYRVDAGSHLSFGVAQPSPCG